MKFGICSELDMVDVVKKIGFDYIEPSLTDTFEMSDAELKEMIAKLKSLDIKAEVCNHFFDNGKHKVVGENTTDLKDISEYLKAAFYKFRCIGGEVAVCGSGKARRYADDFPADRALNQFYELMYMAGNIAKENGITIAIEPLRQGETNIINTVADGLEAVKQINHPNVKVLADLYHVVMTEEGYGAVENSAGNLYHVHTSNPIASGRIYPKFSDEFSQEPFADALKKCGYDLRVSLEAGCKDFETDAAEGLKVLKAIYLK